MWKNEMNLLSSCDVTLYFVSLIRLCYVQSLTGHKSPVTAVSASETTGDIATVCDSGEEPLGNLHMLIIHDLSHDSLFFVSSGWGQ